MLAKTQSVALVGTDAHLVEVEIHIGTGVPSFTIVGLPTKSVREAEQRTRAALVSSDEEWKASRIVANLAPGALRKEGTHFDLPLALGILSARDRIDSGRLAGWVAVGELALGGAVRPVRGVLAAAIACRSAGMRGLVCPAANASEAALVEAVEVVPVETLRDCIAWAKGRWAPPPPAAHSPPVQEDSESLEEVRGHQAAKRALEVAAAGGHNLLLVGPPGSGKTMLARRLPGILPPMGIDEALDVTRVHSVAGLLGERAHLLRSRAFRTPHHNVSLAGMIGGGPGLARPGEASLAHHGVLFLDELTLYRTDVLESLRAPLEEGRVRIARAGGAICYPCRFSLVAAMNPCPCGYAGDSLRTCRCSHHSLEVYRARLSGPLLDRFDIQLAMARPSKGDLLGPPQGESSEVVRRRVEAARVLQADRYDSPRTTNASASKRQLEQACSLAGPARAMIGLAVDSLALSGRGIDRVLRVARTLADLAGSEEVGEEQIGEAISYRTLDDVGAGA
ncbi:MAG: YifB family Mg chelatase-like AAA ATPase [Actinomycetota bacterium]|nr:YifB family Mg chelatase-like AAA ATPase [Actinomycetota bacterium]